jgi:hypothetical protein
VTGFPSMVIVPPGTGTISNVTSVPEMIRGTLVAPESVECPLVCLMRRVLLRKGLPPRPMLTADARHHVSGTSAALGSSGSSPRRVAQILRCEDE